MMIPPLVQGPRGNSVSAAFSIEMSSTATFDHLTVSALAAYIVSCLAPDACTVSQQLSPSQPWESERSQPSADDVLR